MEMNEADNVFLTRMRELARRGGAATKKLVASRPGYYRALGRRGGQASAGSRRARIAAELDGIATNESPIVEAGAAPQAAQASPQPPLSPFKKLMAERGRPSLNATPARNRWDDFAEEQAARAIAQVCQ
jgi:general stress protein YciG